MRNMSIESCMRPRLENQSSPVVFASGNHPNQQRGIFQHLQMRPYSPCDRLYGPHGKHVLHLLPSLAFV